MPRWLKAGIVAAFLLCAAAAVLFVRREPPAAPAERAVPGPAEITAADEITVRNVTRASLEYSLAPDGKPRSGEARRTIAPGAIDRIPASGTVVIEFDRGGESTARSLTPGRAYSFRYDDDGTIEIWLGTHGLPDAEDLAPYVATPGPVVDKMLSMAGVGGNDVVYDIGCGDGRIVIAAATGFGARGVGIDIDPERIRESRENARAIGVESLVRFVEADATKVDISEASVVTLYLLPESNELLRPKLERELRPGTRVVSHNYVIPGWEEREIASARLTDGQGKEHAIFLYRK